MQELIQRLVKELDWFVNAADKREHVIVRCQDLFDEHFVPVDLPGPDQIIDPLLRTVIRPVVGRIYDEILKKIEAK